MDRFNAERMDLIIDLLLLLKVMKRLAKTHAQVASYVEDLLLIAEDLLLRKRGTGSLPTEADLSSAEGEEADALVIPLSALENLRTQFTIAPNLFSKLTKLKTKFGISCFKEGVSTALKSRYHPVLCVSYLVFVLAFLENLRFGLQFGLARKRNLVV